MNAPPASDPAAPAPTATGGQKLGGRYQLDRRIAMGGMGEVWVATDVVLGRRVAIKVLRADVTQRPGFLERFRREARNLAMLSHPAIATLFDYGEHDGSPYLVLELVKGENLAIRLHRDGPLPVDDVVEVISRVASGLAVAHEAGVVHRDIKPANLMMTDEGHVKITDFGISRLADAPSLTAATEVMGTPQYMSPEQVTGQPTSATSDVYSLGIVAFEMLTGHPPFEAESPVTVALAQVHELPPPLPESVPPWLASLVGRSLAKNPADRPADGQALVDELDGPHDTPPTSSALFAATVALPADRTVTPTVAMPPANVVGAPNLSVGRSVVGPLRRHRTKRIVAVALTALAVAALVTAFVLARPDDTDSIVSVEPTLPPTVMTVPVTLAPQPTTLPPTTEPQPTVLTVLVDPADFVGRQQSQVVDELESMGFDVEVRSVDAERGTKKRTVVGLTPTGELTPGTTVELQVYEPRRGSEGDDQDG